MTTRVHGPRPLQPSLGKAFLGGFVALFWLTVLVTVVFGGALLLVFRGLTSVDL
ncbi:MAG: hypothetical protein HOQ22_01725 [Nocardioidaceae bacterium]|nr:hypothetical protein [Nocardioidaceae bacterium]NUS49743.1 hypothetical protein [Nocardioidaceae bacterium]